MQQQQQNVDLESKVRSTLDSNKVEPMAVIPVSNAVSLPLEASLAKIESEIKNELNSNNELLTLLSKLRKNCERNENRIDAEKLLLAEVIIKLNEELRQKITNLDEGIAVILKTNFDEVKKYYKNWLSKPAYTVEEPEEKNEGRGSPRSGTSSSSAFFTPSSYPGQFVQKTQGKTGAEALQEASVPANQGIGETISSEGKATSTQRMGFTQGQSKH